MRTRSSSSTSWAASINGSGQIVGTAKTLRDEEHGFLFSNDVMVDLNELIDPLSRWTIVSANGINDRGQVVGITDVAVLWSEGARYDLNTLVVAGALSPDWVLTSAHDINNRGWIVGDAFNAQTGQTRTHDGDAHPAAP